MYCILDSIQSSFFSVGWSLYSFLATAKNWAPWYQLDRSVSKTAEAMWEHLTVKNKMDVTDKTSSKSGDQGRVLWPRRICQDGGITRSDVDLRIGSWLTCVTKIHRWHVNKKLISALERKMAIFHSVSRMESILKLRAHRWEGKVVLLRTSPAILPQVGTINIPPKSQISPEWALLSYLSTYFLDKENTQTFSDVLNLEPEPTLTLGALPWPRGLTVGAGFSWCEYHSTPHLPYSGSSGPSDPKLWLFLLSPSSVRVHKNVQSNDRLTRKFV